MKLRIVLILALATVGCSSHHPYIDRKDAVYGPPQWHCDMNGGNCELVQYSEPAQLTPVGCFLNQWTIGLGRKAEECKKPKKGAPWKQPK